LKIIKNESNNDSSKVSRAIRKLKYVQNEISEAIKYLESDKACKDATCDAADELYTVNELADALAEDAQMSASDVKVESTEDKDEDDDEEDFNNMHDGE